MGNWTVKGSVTEILMGSLLDDNCKAWCRNIEGSQWDNILSVSADRKRHSSWKLL